ncbi:MAG: hypothetical protein AAGD14_13600 [Planctomycetota bacterium]
MGKVTFRVFGFYIAAIFALWVAGYEIPESPADGPQGSRSFELPPPATFVPDPASVVLPPWDSPSRTPSDAIEVATDAPIEFEDLPVEVRARLELERLRIALPPFTVPALTGRGDGSGRNIPLAAERRPLTVGRRAALRAMMAGQSYLLYIGPPPSRPVLDEAELPMGPFGPIQIARERDGDTGLRLESIGDTSDPQLEEFVADFNGEMHHAFRRGLVGNLGAHGVPTLALYLRPEADELFFELMVDPVDGTVTRQPDGRSIRIDIGAKDGLRRGTRFVLRQRTRVRVVIGIVEVIEVADRSSRARIVERFPVPWRDDRPTVVSSPFFVRGRLARVRTPGPIEELKGIPGIEIIEERDGWPDAFILRPGAMVEGPIAAWGVYARLVRWFRPQLQDAR